MGISVEKKPVNGLDALRAISTGPHDVEAPRKSIPVTLIMGVARRFRRTWDHTPHLFGGSNDAKVEWEYREGPTFLNILREHVGADFLDGKEVLDAGCGWGGKAIYYAENTLLKSITGIDLPGVYVPEASENFARRKGVSNSSFLAGNVEAMPFASNRFDILIMEDVMEHVTSPEAVLQECFRVLKPGGRILVKFPSFKMMYAHHLDRALNLPGLHYVLPMKIWAGGLNYLLLEEGSRLCYEPFSRVIPSKYGPNVTKNLNGLDFSGFRRLLADVSFRTRLLKLVPYQAAEGNRSVLKFFYNLAYGISPFREFLSHFVLYSGEKVAGRQDDAS